MSSYHSSFSYLNINSSTDMHWLIVHFDADQGETDSYLSQEQIYTDSHKGTRRLLYGTKWDSVANVKITVIKQNLSDFTEAECRTAYKWLTGNPTVNYLDLYAGDSLRYSFLGTVKDVKPQKLDSRTVGLNIYFESVNPWAWSPMQTVKCSFVQSLSVDGDGVLSATADGKSLSVDTDGILKHNSGQFSITDGGIIYLSNSGSSTAPLQINNLSDDLYTYITMDTVITNTNCTQLSIKNNTLDEETKINAISAGEIITLNSNQFIASDKSGKIFGNTFNFKWPRLAPGINNIEISVDGRCVIEFKYRYPIKIGDCAIDVYVSNNNDCGCPDNTDYGFVPWHDVTDTPTTVAGYGITDVYTESEIDIKLSNINIGGNVNINESDLDRTLADILN